MTGERIIMKGRKNKEVVLRNRVFPVLPVGGSVENKIIELAAKKLFPWNLQIVTRTQKDSILSN